MLDEPRPVSPLKRRFDLLKNLLAREISRTTRYADEVIQCHRLPHDDGRLLEKLECARKSVVSSSDTLEDFSAEPHAAPVILIDGALNHELDIQKLLTEIRGKLNRRSRVIIVLYNPYLRVLFQCATLLGLRKGEMPSTFITEADLHNLATLSEFQLVRERPCAHLPFDALGVGPLVNSVLSMIPILRKTALTYVITLRPKIKETSAPSLTVVIPARNEKGNIEDALKRLPALQWNGEPANIDVIFVEGHSTDGTWDEILRVQKAWGERIRIQAFQQPGKGKADAVRLGFSKAEGDLLVVLDADLTVPPEDLGKFYEAYCAGYGDFINGSRLVYPMEGEAMRFLNWLGNIFFAKSLSWVLDTKLSDSLCGTKLCSRLDYRRFTRWREDFGDFDPFGDYEMIFPACILGLGTIDIPVYYRARTYGQTNIHRFRHGLLLLKMTLTGLLRVKSSF